MFADVRCPNCSVIVFPSHERLEFLPERPILRRGPCGEMACSACFDRWCETCSAKHDPGHVQVDVYAELIFTYFYKLIMQKNSLLTQKPQGKTKSDIQLVPFNDHGLVNKWPDCKFLRKLIKQTGDKQQEVFRLIARIKDPLKAHELRLSQDKEGNIWINLINLPDVILALKDCLTQLGRGRNIYIKRNSIILPSEISVLGKWNFAQTILMIPMITTQ